MSGHMTMTVRATVDDPVDGVMRLMGDVQRFGFELQTLALEVGHERAGVVAMTLSVPSGTDTGSLKARFNRHPSVVFVQAEGPVKARIPDAAELAA